MGERLTYGILARYRVVLVERLGGLFFAGRRSRTEDNSGLYCGDHLTVLLVVVCDTQSTGFKWERASLSNGIPILVTALLR